MNKVVLKEFSKEQLWIKVVFYGLFALVGFELLHFSNIGFTNPIKYVPVIYYTFAFLSLVTYFGNRIKGDYELLYFGLINVIVGTFTLVNNLYPNSGFILADAVLLYSILNVINGGFTCLRMLKERNIQVFMKIAITVMLLFMGVFVISAIYDKVEYGTLILGYYFAAYGLLYLLEIFVNVIIGNKKLEKAILNYVDFGEEPVVSEPVEEKKEEPKTIKPVKLGKITNAKKEIKPTTKKVTKKVVKNRTVRKIRRK